ncbi:MAG TPA: 2Fe-2S iron-sulfur cluster-binding protein [Candidatus Binatia bacterium]|nr:2Fe-2S iron-sulfur cluster-binding protein [Candidatus Binatia bacterium]
MPIVTFMPVGQSFDVAQGTTILVAAIQNGLRLRHDCTEAICGTDRVTIVAGKEHLSEKDDNEELTLEMMNSKPDDRLACVARIVGDVTVEVPD